MIRTYRKNGLDYPRQWYITWKIGFFGRFKVRKHIKAGKMVEAIKEIRRQTGAGLKDAKRWIDERY